MADGLAAQLGQFAVDMGRSGLPDEAATDVKRRILDIVGLALAAKNEDVAEVAAAVAAGWGGPEESTVIGTSKAHPASSAAFVNGTLAHALDFDDTHLPSVLHPSASVVPASLAVAEAVDASGVDVMAAAAIGIEVCVRLGMASYDPDSRSHILFDKGFHATSICGTIGAAAAAGVLLGLDAEGIAHALGIAASMGSGLIEANRSGGTVKRIHCGWAAHSGVVAAQLAAAGLTGPEHVFEGRFGYFNAYSDGRFDPEAVTGDLGVNWELTRIFFKPYPINHFTHAGVDAALALKERGVTPDEIARIELGVAGPTLRTIAEPADLKARPPTGYYARFSGPFTVASALVGGGGLGVASSDFSDESVRDPVRLRLAGLVTCAADEEASAAFPHQFGGVLRIAMNDGSEYEHRVVHNRGGPENPLSAEELLTKYRLNAAEVLPAAQIEQLADRIHHLDAETSVRTLMQLTA